MTERSSTIDFESLQFLGIPVEHHHSIGSTNDEAFRRADEGAPEGLVVVADSQTRGRGRLGRMWWDVPRLSLPFSILLHPGIPLPQFPLLALGMACAVAEAGEEAIGAPLEVKWPNDVLHDRRKLCGVLAESRAGGTARSSLVIGAGVNVNQRTEDFPSDIRDRATSLFIAGGGLTLRSRDVLASILVRFERYYGMSQRGDESALWSEVTRRLPSPGAELSVLVGGQRIHAVLEGITETGALRLRERGKDEATVLVTGEIA